jgi:SAM-dependent methyltransferase
LAPTLQGRHADGYDRTYYADLSAGSDPSAQTIAPWIQALLIPRSVVDVGCGVGSWLRAFMDLGVEDVVGLDGDWVPQSELRIPRDRFRTVDLRVPPPPERRFELAMCLEVAEHLPQSAARGLVEVLVGLAPVVLFSAAAPGQRGHDHFNEQWPDYWASRFDDHRYAAFDVVRPRFWNDPSVKWWYPQNALLYAERGSEVGRRIELEMGPPLEEAPPSLVHPGMLAAIEKLHAAELESRRSLRGIAEGLGPALRMQGRRLLARRSGR